MHGNGAKMNILVLNYEFPPLGGGAAPVSEDIATELCKKGHQVTVVTMGYRDLPSKETKQGVEIYRLKCWRSSQNVCKPWEQYTYLLAVRKFMRGYMKTHTVDVCHAHFVVPTGEAARWVKRKYQIPYIITAHGSDVEGHNRKKSVLWMQRILRSSWRKIVRESKCVVSPSVYLMDLMKKNYPQGRYVYIPNGIDFNGFTALNQQEQKERVILIMGRLQRFKNVQTILQAAAMTDLSGWKIEILGDGPYRAELEQLSKELGLEGKISFRGWLDHGSEEQLSYLKKASVYISASEFENCPMSVIEAIAAGCSPLLSDIPGHRQLFDGDDCFFDVGDAEALAKKLGTLMRTQDFGTKIDVSGYDWEHIISRYEDVLSGQQASQSRKVLFVIRSLKGGGAERALSNIVTHFPDDWQIDILVDSEAVVEYPYKGNLLSLGLDNCKNRKSPFFLMKEMVKKTKYLRRIKKKNGYEACISFLDTSNVANILSGKKYCKTIISIRVDMTAKESKLLYRISAWPLMQLFYKRADRIVAVSKEIEEKLKKQFEISEYSITTITNGYDETAIMRQAGQEPQDNVDTFNRPLVVTAGRLNEQKGQWHLIRSFAKVVKEIPDAMLLIMGEGALREYLQKVIQVNGLEENVVLLGRCDNPFWYEVKADVFVLPSLYEGYPNALAEAVCCGIPCVATDFHSGAREILAPDMDIMGERVSGLTEAQYGILTPLCGGQQYSGVEPLENAERQLADVIVMLLSDEARNQYYRKQSEIRRESLSIEETVKEWIRVIEE